jgi:hypothetical protein
LSAARGRREARCNNSRALFFFARSSVVVEEARPAGLAARESSALFLSAAVRPLWPDLRDLSSII